MPDHPQRAYRGAGHHDRQNSSSGSDPLAELARLIGGQNDSFAAPSRDARDEQAWHPGHHDPREAAARSEYPEPSPPSAEPAAYGSTYGGYAQPRRPAPAQYGVPPGYAGHDHGGDPFYREPDTHDGQDGYDEYDDGVPARRRGGMLTVMAVISLGLIGTAAAFGYRAVFGNNGSSPPPVIKADTTPAKIVPAATPGDQAKQIYDRVGERPPAEKVVSREEKPVDVNDSLKTPRVVGGPAITATTPAANPVAPQPPALPANASALAAPNASGPAAPKKVRTVTIKPDGADAEPPVPSAGRVAAPAPQLSAPAPVAPARVATAAAQDLAPPPPAPPAPARTVTTRAPVPQAAPNPNAPLSLAPPPVGGAAPAARAPMRTASAPAPAAQASAAGGGYAVQVSSQRTEAEAQTAFRALQSKYPEQLGGQQPMIRRADLGDKGVFYRVQIGPFGSSDQAAQLCTSLKNAGGSCVVQRN
jgi:hypothetical protein